jgi:hypothetical protein
VPEQMDKKNTVRIEGPVTAATNHARLTKPAQLLAAI